MKLIKTILLATCVLAIWRAVPQARAGVTLTTLVSFNFTNGISPGGKNALVQARDGNFYGMTVRGGALYNNDPNQNYGTIFKMTPDGTLTTLVSFTGTNGPYFGGNPTALLQGRDGYLYGTTYDLGPAQGGTVFRVDTNGNFTSLYFFGTVVNDDDIPDGTQPVGLMQASDGKLYGTTTAAGIWQGGTIFKITTNGSLTTLYSLEPNGCYLCGYNPGSGLIQDKNGNFYGTDYNGGANGSGGTVFELDSNLGFSVLFSFGPGFGANPNGSEPLATLLQGKDGNFYGTTMQGGPSNYGTIFKISPDGMHTTLVSSYMNGGFSSPLIQATDGNFYGTTGSTVFQMTPGGTITTLYSFAQAYLDNGGSYIGGQYPGALMQATDGNFYGTTSQGGTNGVGTIFRLSVPLQPVLKTIAETAGAVTFAWSSVSGLTYQLQYNTDLSSTNWINLGSSVTASNNTVSASDSMTNSQCFYRIMLLQ
jgi:uncharacterized repeat protein (TIGR03803 family)